jgi:hypothetical protein
MKTSPSRQTALGMEAVSFLVRGLRLSKPELKDTAYNSPANAQKIKTCKVIMLCRFCILNLQGFGNLAG